MKAPQKLAGKKVGILAADGFEYIEYAVPAAALTAAGATVEVVSLHGGRIRGMNLTEPTRTVAVDRVLGEQAALSYDALLIIGGFVGPDLLRQSRVVRELVRGFDQAGKPIAVICHGPWVLISAGVMRGRRVASWPSLRDDVVNAGGTWRDDELVRDNNWVSSRGPQDLPRFVPAMVELFARGATCPMEGPMEGASISDVSSPPRDEPPKLAVAAARALPGPGASAALGAAAAIALGSLALRRAVRSAL
ncbi:MAG: ThiJ/PfpI family protein [Labilithrix sp.]|nr:ThiJ/PfpI family protein [Labilithrix sp.]